MAGIYKRSLGPFGGRRECDLNDIRTTPADELSSWLGDDVCTNCGGATQHGKLFCSEKCKLADADEVAQTSRTSLGADTVDSFSSPSRPDPLVREANAGKFRYPCPPSPNLLAQYSAPLKATSLTSPALSAYQSSFPTARGRYHRASNVSTDGFPAGMHKKRSSSQSTFSSVSDSNGSTSAFASTDPSTPSPAYGATEDDASDLDATEFQLPPSVSTASAVMLRRSTRDSPKSMDAPMPPMNEGSQQKSPMWYARRPSTTNLPPSLWYTSPAVTATTKVTATGRGLPAHNAHRGDAQATLTRKAMMEFYASSKKMTSPASPKPGQLVNGVAMRRGHSDQPSARSPPQIQSAASSAGKTMRATSPEGSRAFSPASGIEVVCDRCRTLSNMSGDVDIYAASVRSPLDSRRGSASSSENRSLLHKHKHSHSAAAGLFFTQLHAREEQEKASAAIDATAKNSSSRYLSRSRSLQQTPLQASSPKTAALTSQHVDVRSSPHRGRSAVRGRSSTQRSPSPPRAAARRHTADQSTSASPLDLSPRSIPISIGSNPRTDAAKNNYHEDQALRSALSERPSPLALQSHLEEASPSGSLETRGRGRDRGKSSSRARSPARRDWIHRDCEISWAGYGHRSADRGSPTGSKLRYRDRRIRIGRKHDPGFDDVELELEDGSGSQSSITSSVDSNPRRGRTTRRV